MRPRARIDPVPGLFSLADVEICGRTFAEDVPSKATFAQAIARPRVIQKIQRPLPALLLVAIAGATQGQVPTQCLEVESILVDACNWQNECAGSPEAMNEMFRFRVGPDPIDINDLVVEWPNEPWQGLVQNATTAGLVDQINATVEGCGWLLEPPAGIIPPGARVLLVTSTGMCVQGNSFAGLNDTLHVVFQGGSNSVAHFANQSNGPVVVDEPGDPSFRTLIVTHTPTNCADTVTYDRSLLVNIYGSYGGLAAENDGATVEFSWPGTPDVTYVNNGCQAPIGSWEVHIGEVIGDACTDGSVQLSATASAGLTDPSWQGGTGSFSDPQALTTTYTPGAGEQGEVTIGFCALGPCGEAVCDSVIIQAGTPPAVQILTDGAAALCAGGTLELVAVGNGASLWSTGSTNDTITVDAPGTYVVTTTNACGSATDSITVVELSPPIAQISGPATFCVGSTVQLTATGGDHYLWNTGEDSAVIAITEGGTYAVTVTNACGSDQDSIEVDTEGIDAEFEADVYIGDAPLQVMFLNLSVPDDQMFQWDLGDGTTTNEHSPVHVFGQPGEYLVQLVATMDACSDTASVIIVVNDPFGPVVPSWVEVPNIFTPNGDGRNDVLELMGEGLEQVEMKIFNRWGEMIYMIEFPRQVWDGRSFAGEVASEGTYFFELRAKGADGQHHELRGAVTLLR